MAHQKACALNQNEVDAIHLFLGLLALKDGVAITILQKLKIDPQAMILRANAPSLPDRITLGKLPYSSLAARVVEQAIGEANALRHNYIGSEHLLLALACVEEGEVFRILQEFKLNADMVRAELIRVVGPKDSPSDVQVLTKNFPEEHGTLTKPLDSLLRIFFAIPQDKHIASVTVTLK